MQRIQRKIDRHKITDDFDRCVCRKVRFGNIGDERLRPAYREGPTTWRANRKDARPHHATGPARHRRLAEVAGKRLQLLRETVPSAKAIAYLRNPTNPIYAESETKQVEDAARAQCKMKQYRR
jgi:hypothetical protein